MGSRYPDGVAVIPNLFRDLWNLERMAGFSVLVISAMGLRSVASSGARQLFAKKSGKFLPENLWVKK